MHHLVEKIFNQERLEKAEASALLTSITNQELNNEQCVATLSALQMRPLNTAELNGFRESLLEKALRPDLPAENAIDVCGTGGDGKNTFNISTLAALVIAGAGYRVIKHGNYGVSSNCGSSTVLEQFGMKFTADETTLNQQLEQANICFLHAPLFHPAMKAVAGIRKNLAMRTFFNYLGPLVNPVQPDHQLTGVYHLKIARMYDQILRECRKNYGIIHSTDGYDEISLTGPVKIFSPEDETLMYPEELGFKTLDSSEISGGKNPVSSAAIFLDVLKNNSTKQQQAVVVVNAALGIQCLQPEKSFSACVEEAEFAIHSGKALESLKKTIEISQN